MSECDVSVVIVNYNTRDMLRDCLLSIREHSGPVRLETIVVDNASADGSVQMVRSDFPEVAVIANDDNVGFAPANNQGMRIARGRYILLLNSDTLVMDDAIAKTAAFADKRPDAAVVGCRILNPDSSLQPSCFMFPCMLNLVLMVTHSYRIFPRSRFFGRERMSWWDRNDERAVEVVTGCFMLVRREAMLQVGMMDGSFFFYGEEADWCRRFSKAGWKLLFTPSARITHLEGASAKRLRWKSDALQTRAVLRLFRKHYGPRQETIAAWLLWTFNFTHMIGWWLLALLSFGNCRTAEVRWRHFANIIRYWDVDEAVLRPPGFKSGGRGHRLREVGSAK